MRHRQAGVVLALVGMVLLAGVSMAATQPIGPIDDFEDNDINAENPYVTGWSGDLTSFGTNSSAALNGSISGEWEPGGAEAIRVDRDVPRDGWVNWSMRVRGETAPDNPQHRININNSNTLIASVIYEESGDAVQIAGANTVTVGGWDEAGEIDNWQLYFDASADEVEFYRNGTSVGTLSFANAAGGWDRWELRTVPGGDPVNDAQILIDNVGATFDAHEPEFDNASATPTGEINQRKQTLSIDLSDADFGDPQNDSLTVDWYQDGSQFASETVTSNGTISQSTDFVTGGEHTWHAEVTDTYGITNTSATFTVDVPRNLTIYNESAPEQIVNQSTNVEVTFFADDTVITRNSTDGIVNLSGLPADEPFIARASADGWYSRTKIIPSLFEDQRLYLANKTVVTANEVRFDLNDQSGRFPRDESDLYIKKALTRNGSTTFETIHSDEFGATGITVDLENDTRYRLVVENGQGDRRNVGPYTSTTSELVELTPGVAGLNLDPAPGTYEWDAEFDNSTGTYGSVVFDYADDGNLTDELRVTIYERGNASNEFVNTTEPGPLGNATITYMLQNNDERNLTFAVEFEADRDGETENGLKYVSRTPDERLPGLADWIQEMLAFVVLILLGASFTVRDHHIGAAILPIFAGFFWYMQWLEGVTSGAAIVLALALAGGVQISRRAG